MASYELVGLNESTPQLLAPTSTDTGVVPGILSVTNATDATTTTAAALKTAGGLAVVKQSRLGGSVTLSAGADLIVTEGKITITDTADELALQVTASSATTNAARVTANSLTTGVGFQVDSSSADTNTRSVVILGNYSALATGATTLELVQASTGDALKLTSGNLTLSEGKITVTDTANEIAVGITSSSTTENGVDIIVSSLQTGTGLRVYSNSANTGAFNLLNLVNDNTSATGAYCARMQQDAANAFMNLVGTEGANVTDPISTFVTVMGTLQKMVQVDLNGTKGWIQVYNDPIS